MITKLVVVYLATGELWDHFATLWDRNMSLLFYGKRIWELELTVRLICQGTDKAEAMAHIPSIRLERLVTSVW